MSSLTKSQKWVLVAFASTALTLAITFFLQGDVRTYGYVITGLLVAAFAVLQGGNQKNKNG